MVNPELIKWPESISRIAKNIRDSDVPLWSKNFTDTRDRTESHEGQFDQLSYPFGAIVVAKLLCEAAGDNSRLFMKYLSKAGFLLDPENFTDPDTWGKSKKEAEGKEIQGLEV